MGKMRVYQLAKELNMQSKELVETLMELGVEVSSHMSTVEDETAQLVFDMLKKGNDKDGKKEKKEVSSKKDVKEKKDSGKKTPQKKAETRSVKTNKGQDETKKDSKDVKQAAEDSGKYDITAPITVRELADQIDFPANKLIKELIGLGIMANVNHTLDTEILEKLNENLNLKINLVEKPQAKSEYKNPEKIGPEVLDKPEDLKLRSPIVTVMGHVDHGKTTLLDVIRKTRVTDSEAGGITQHIGAYQADVNDKKITFIDTPGHEAFTAMRARGAQLTDIAILVVAADDGVMPQTIEAINHAKAAEIPIIIAVNKIDKANAQPDRVKQELIEHGLVPEDWGGDTITVPISALKEENIDELLEMVLLVAEMEELKANPDRLAEGVIIEAELDRGRGPVATVLVKNGTLHVGDALLSGATYGRVRAMLNDKGERVEEAGPSAPVIVLGFSDVPNAGDYFEVLEDEKMARQVAEERQTIRHEKEIHQEAKISLEDLYQQIQEGEVKELNIIIKADVQGSIEALRDSLLRLGTDEVSINVIHTGVGAINETDVNLASASNAIIIGFNVRPDSNAHNAAEKEKVDIKHYRVIYKAIEEIRDALEGLLDPELKEVVTGRAEVRATFKVPNVGIISGTYVKEGEVNRNSLVRLIRDGRIVHEGNISSLKRFENDVREVKEGFECGLGIEGYNDIKVGDILEIYKFEEIKRTL